MELGNYDSDVPDDPEESDDFGDPDKADDQHTNLIIFNWTLCGPCFSVWGLDDLSISFLKTYKLSILQFPS